ncbi:hypothetical protein MED297_08236 [Reinekea sp. MED297]|uniref:LysM domain-containing protein n=2 Tax=Reinekea TaxID=230494 RepID=A4BCY0_9GAMM|nr:hypothetical protein MED297_08236 [Reinekea sp. MED297] [Reinekea blandensis MED297]
MLSEPAQDGGKILLPLGLYESKPDDEVEGSAELTLTSTRVALQAPDAEEGQALDVPLPPGWLYIFINGYLWHEYEVTDQAQQLRGIDLQIQQTLDHRPATGLSVDHITLPTIMEGEAAQIQVAFSHTQWSWARICSLGGMNPEDPRLKHWVRDGENLSRIAQRYSFCKGYQALSDRNGLGNPSDIKVGQWLTLRNPDTPIGDVDTQRQQRMGAPLCDQNNMTDGVLTVQDPVGYVDLLNAAMVTTHLKIEEIISDMNGAGQTPQGQFQQSLRKDSLAEDASNYEPINATQFGLDASATHNDFAQTTQMAQIIYPMLFDEKSFEKLDSDARDYLNDAKENIDSDALKRWLHVDVRKQYRDNFRHVQKSLIKYLLDEENPYESCSHALTFWDCLEDYAWLPALTYSQLWAKTSEALSLVLTDPNVQDYSYDLPETVEAERKEQSNGLDLIEALACQDHKAHTWLFPSDSDIDVTSPDVFTAEKSDSIDSPEMRVGDYQASIDLLLSAHAPNAETVAGLMKKPSVGVPDVVDRFLLVLSNYKKHYDLKNSSPSTIDIDNLFTKVSKATGLPVLSKVHILEEAAAMDGVIAPGEYRIKQLFGLENTTNLQRRQARAQTRSEVKSGSMRWIDVTDEAGNRLGSNTLTDLRPYRGPNLDTPDLRWTDVFREQVSNTDGSATRYTSKVRMIVVPETSWTEDMANRLHQKAKSQSALRNIYRSIPSALLILEVFSFGQALQGLQNESRHNRSAKYLLAKHTAFVAAATLEALEAWKGSDRLILMLSSRGGHIGALASRTVTVSIKGIPLSFPMYRFMGLGVAAIAAVDCAISTIDLTHKHDHDAAIATALSGLLGVASLACFFIASNAIVPVAAWIPVWGWILAGAAVLAGLIATWLTDSRFEAWAKHCPFAKDKENRLDHDDLNSAEKVFNELQDLLFCPSVSFSHREVHSETYEVTVEISHPAFVNEKSSLEWRLTASYADVSNNRRYGSYRHDKDFTEEELEQKLKEITLLGSNEQPTGLRIRYNFNLPDVSSFLWIDIIHNFQFRLFVRHIMPNGTSLPINNSDNDDSWNDDIGWVVGRHELEVEK